MASASAWKQQAGGPILLLGRSIYMYSEGDIITCWEQWTLEDTQVQRSERRRRHDTSEGRATCDCWIPRLFTIQSHIYGFQLFLNTIVFLAEANLHSKHHFPVPPSTMKLRQLRLLRQRDGGCLILAKRDI